MVSLMALSGVTVDWPTGVITVPREGMTIVQTVPSEILEMQLNEFHLALKDLEDSVPGMPLTKTHNHNTEVILGGITYARIIEIPDPYTITFENGFYAVNLVGANSNVGDRVNINNVSVRSNNSAGLISTTTVEFASFNGRVTIDVDSPYAGTTFPTGTEQQPVNNLDDAILIAEFRGLREFYFLSDYTFDSTVDIEDYTLRGRGLQTTVLTLESGVDFHGSEIIDTQVTGIGQGVDSIRNSYVVDLEFQDRQTVTEAILIQDSVIAGDITFASGFTGDVQILDSWGMPDVLQSPPTISMNNSTATLQMRNYSGFVLLADITQDVDVRVFLASGGATMLPSITNGDFIFTGIGDLINNSTSYDELNTESLISQTIISTAVWDEPISNHLIDGSTGLSVGVAQFGGQVHVDTNWSLRNNIPNWNGI